MSYVTSYVLKPFSGLAKVLREASDDCANGYLDPRERLRKITNVFLNCNLMSAQEAAYHVLSLPLCKKSRKCIFINTNPISERIRILKSNAALKKSNEMQPDSTEIFADDAFKKYTMRNKKYNDICLADFIANHTKKTKNATNDDEIDNDINTDDINEERYRNRQQSAIIRYRIYKLHQDPINYYREQILLFLPWRNEKTEVENIDHPVVYKKNESIIETNRKLFAIISDEELDDTWEKLMNDLENENKINDTLETDKIEYPVDIFEQGGCKLDNKKPEKPINKYTCPTRISSEQMYEMFQNLNPEQKEFAMHVLNYFKLNKIPLRIFLNGFSRSWKKLSD